MSGPIVVLDPTTGAAATSVQLVSRPDSFTGLVVGLLDNGKPNSDRLLAMLADRLDGEGMKDVVRLRKPNIGRVAPAAMIEELARCDVVVTGVGDCAGCCSCSVQDGIALERSGVPTYVVVTTDLTTIATIAATTAGVPDYPFLVVDHPLGALSEDRLQGRAAHAHDQILASRSAVRPPA
jgi:hypothetical protein